MSRTISPIAIDLGGMNTGVYMGHYIEGTIPDATESALTTIVMPEEGGKMTWSQTARTATRHRIRANKRAKLAKRLLKVVILNGVNHPLSATEWEALSGLLNRRGYNRTESELDLSPLNNADPYLFSELLSGFFSADIPLNDQWETLSQDIDRLRELNDLKNFGITRKEAKKQLFTNSDPDERDGLLKAYHCLQDAVTEILDNIDFGHQHRRFYLADVKAEIEKDSRFAALKEKIPSDELFHLVGNISNLQLRTLRWYFNDINMIKADYLDEARLKKVIIRWLKGWHPDDESRDNRNSALKTLSSLSALEALKNIDPELTIPPYEDQNNRRPPKDQTLWLNPLSLNTLFGNKWKIWVNNLMTTQPSWADGIDDVLSFFERKSRLKPENRTPDATKMYHDAIFLQRILDRSKVLDVYSLRAIVRGSKSQSMEAAKRKLTQDLGSQHIDDFISFATLYYTELELAKQGLWIEKESNLFERADINPPSKKKILHLLVGNILNHKFNEQSFAKFLDEIWQAKVIGSSSIRSICTKIEETRKEHGNLFNTYINSIAFRIQRDPSLEKQLKGAEKDVWKVKQASEKAANKLAELLQHDAIKQSKYNNPFSLAQLYTLIETDRHGFSKVTLAAHKELYWRMLQVPTDKGAASAHCSRLVADTIRPFDGVLRRILERQAYEIANLKVNQIKNLDVKTKELLIPIIAEENRFTFSIGLADIKKDGAKRKKLEELQENQTNRWLSKEERIKSQNELCPYTGELIGNKGEIDHIIPRSYSRDNNGTVFDSEANLIWCSRKGNQIKKDQRYGIRDLKSNYLSKTFGTDNISTIIERLEFSIDKLPDNFLYQDLSKDEQTNVRHSLFLDTDSTAYQKVKRQLAVQQSSRVNGTQAWLIRSVMEKITHQLGSWASAKGINLQFCASRVSAEAASSSRRQLSEHNSIYTKITPQPTASHAIDALCALAVAASDSLYTELALGDSINEDAPFMESLLPTSVSILWVERKARYNKENIASQPLFKEGIYSEDFLPIWCSKKGIRVGFDPNFNFIEWQGKDSNSLLDLLTNVADQGPKILSYIDSDKPTKITINKNVAFDLLAKIARQEGTDVDRSIADLLDAIRYSTAKKECHSKIYDSQKKAFQPANEILKDKNFDIGLKYTNKTYGKLQGKLRLPAYYEWKNLLNQPELANKLGTKGDDINWLKLQERVFAAGSSRPHEKTRRVFSLPIIDNPSGGYRIKRKTPTGQFIWQLMAIEGTGSEGFAVYDGKIDWNTPVAIKPIQASNVTGVGERWYKEPDNTVKFDDWLPLNCDIPNITNLSMAPGTKDRRYIRIEQPFNVFQQWLTASGVSIDNPLALPSSIKVDGAKFAEKHNADILGKPRSNLFIEKLGVYIVYWYIVESSSSSMRNAYQESYTRKINLQSNIKVQSPQKNTALENYDNA